MCALCVSVSQSVPSAAESTRSAAGVSRRLCFPPFLRYFRRLWKVGLPLPNRVASRSTHGMEFLRLTFTENNGVPSPSPLRGARRTLQGVDSCFTGWVIILAWFSDSASRVDCGASPVKICAHVPIIRRVRAGRLPCRASVEHSH